jgi:hypothetical protein
MGMVYCWALLVEARLRPKHVAASRPAIILQLLLPLRRADHLELLLGLLGASDHRWNWETPAGTRKHLLLLTLLL